MKNHHVVACLCTQNRLACAVLTVLFAGVLAARAAAATSVVTGAVHLSSPTEVSVDGLLAAVDPAKAATVLGICCGTGAEPTRLNTVETVAPELGAFSCTFSDLPLDVPCYFRAFVAHADGTTVYGAARRIASLAPLGAGYLSESFEGAAFPPVGWAKRLEAGGSGWHRLPAGRTPMPGWMSCSTSTPPGGGDYLAYCTYPNSVHFPEGSSDGVNDQWLISRRIRNVQPTTTLSFYLSASFLNFADNVYVLLSTASQDPADFTIEAAHYSWPREGIPADPDDNCVPYEQKSVPIGSLVPAGSDVYVAFREYHGNNWYDVRAVQLDLVESGHLDSYVIDFDGLDDAITLPIAADPGSYTIEAWVRPLATSQVNIVARNAGDPAAAYSHALSIDGGGCFRHSAVDYSLRQVAGTTAVQAGQWHHVAGTAESNGMMRLYVNGIEEGTARSIGPLWEDGSQYTVAGATGDAGAINPFEGQIAELRFWNRALSVTEIRDNMHRYLRGVEDGLHACYRLEAPGAAVADWGPHGLDGVFLDGPAVVAASTCPIGPAELTLWDGLRGVWSTLPVNDAVAAHGLAFSTGIGTDGTHAICGSNGATGTATAQLPPETGLRLAREWLVRETGAVTGAMIFDLGAAGGTELGLVDAAQYQLLTRAEAGDAFTVAIDGADARSGNLVTFNSVALDNLRYTLAVNDVPPTVTTAAVSDVTATTALCGGTVTDDGTAAVTARGVCWATTAGPALGACDGFTEDGTGTGAFVSALTGLAPGATYYVRAYATNSAGTAYGEERSFTANVQPVAQDDAYVFYPGVACSVTQSVLDNDADAQSLMAVLVTGPVQGAFALHADGTFDYTPADAVYVDAFVYVANDGADDSNQATVTLDVAPAAWNGIGGWNDALYWSGAAVPGAADGVVIQSGAVVVPAGTRSGTVTVQDGRALIEDNVRLGSLTVENGWVIVTGNVEVQDLTIESGAAVSVPLQPFALTVRGDFHDNGGELRACGGGVIVIEGDVYDGGAKAITVGSALKIYSSVDLGE